MGKFTCLGAIRQLLNIFFASVQPRAYWGLSLLVCNSLIIQHFLCLCTIIELSSQDLACMQEATYWEHCLFMCNG